MHKLSKSNSPLTPITPPPRHLGGHLDTWLAGGILESSSLAKTAEVVEFARGLYETVVPQPTTEQVKRTIVNKFGPNVYVETRGTLRKLGEEFGPPKA
mmetsp:Transcript_34564/g.90527  ORF Transcript_34564/g.90527 Transcript_34564/m.90527 type:complete len:98 (+) Transcript_34564:113-406(+)